MLKIVPDPPYELPDPSPTLEDVMTRMSEQLALALAVAQQPIPLPSNPSAHITFVAATHKIVSARGLLELAVSRFIRSIEHSEDDQDGKGFDHMDDDRWYRRLR